MFLICTHSVLHLTGRAHRITLCNNYVKMRIHFFEDIKMSIAFITFCDGLAYNNCNTRGHCQCQ